MFQTKEPKLKERLEWCTCALNSATAITCTKLLYFGFYKFLSDVIFAALEAKSIGANYKYSVLKLCKPDFVSNGYQLTYLWIGTAFAGG